MSLFLACCRGCCAEFKFSVSLRRASRRAGTDVTLTMNKISRMMMSVFRWIEVMLLDMLQCCALMQGPASRPRARQARKVGLGWTSLMEAIKW